jgi:hypothetical protein
MKKENHSLLDHVYLPIALFAFVHLKISFICRDICTIRATVDFYHSVESLSPISLTTCYF